MSTNPRHLLAVGIEWVASVTYDFACRLFNLSDRLDPEDDD